MENYCTVALQVYFVKQHLPFWALLLEWLSETGACTPLHQKQKRKDVIKQTRGRINERIEILWLLRQGRSYFLKGLMHLLALNFLWDYHYKQFMQIPQTYHRALWSLCCWWFVSTGLAPASKADRKLQQEVINPNFLGFREHYCGTEFNCQNCYSLFHQIV